MRRGVVVAVLVVALAACGGGKDKKKTARTTTTSSSTTTLVTTTTVPGFGTPEDAVRAYLEGKGYVYAGDCASTDPNADIGKWCSILSADNGDSRVYAVGPTFAEVVEQVTVTRGAGGWTVTSSEAVPAIG